MRGRQRGRKNNATVIKEYLQDTFSDIAITDLADMNQAMVDKAKDGSVMAYRSIVDNMNKVVEQESKDNQVDTGIEILINRDGVTIKGGGLGEGGVEDGGGSTISIPSQSQSQSEVPNIQLSNMVLGSHSRNQVGVLKLGDYYKDYVGPLQKKERQHEGSIANHFETEILHQWKGEVMGLNDICRIEGIKSQRVYWLMKRYDLSLEDAVQEVIELTDLPINSEDL